MLHVITANPVEVRKLTDYHENFAIVHLYDKRILPLADGSLGYQFNIYHQDGMDLSEWDEYENTDNMKFSFIPVVSIKEALEHIADSLIESEDTVEERAKAAGIEKDEIMASCVCGKDWNSKVVRHLNKDIAKDHSEIRVTDMYQHFKFTSEAKMVRFVKTALGSEFVYPEDPIAYAYALHRVLGGNLP